MPRTLEEYDTQPGRRGREIYSLKQRLEIFWNSIDKTSSPKGCWLWTRSVMKSGGYGQMTVNKQWWRAHVLSWTIANGPVPDGMCVCHECDVPRCVRPDHLFLGTRNDNMQDMIQKGRAIHPKGIDSPNARLSEKKVLEISRLNKSGVSGAELGRRFKISKTHAMNIVNGKKWKHLPSAS
jgi:hypothetical protein